MDVTAEALESALAQIAPHTRPASADDATLGAEPRVVVEPEDERQVADILRYANGAGLAVIPRGGGSQLAIGNPPRRADIILSTARMNQLVEHAPHDLTVSAQAGMRLADLQRILGAAGQWLALDPLLDPTATLGGLISTNASGARRLRYGGVRDQIIGVRVALADGTIARGGGKVVKNVAGYDLPKLYTGALGALGVIISANFRLYPLPAFSATARLDAATLAALGSVVQRILAQPLTPAALDIFSPAATGAPYTLVAHFESGVREAVETQTRTVSAAPIADGALPRDILSGEDDARFWRDADALWRAPLPGPAADDAARTAQATIKASLPLTAVADWLMALEAACADGAMAARWRAHAGHGIVFAQMRAAPDTLAARIASLRRDASERRGSLVITELPPALVGAIDPWGPVAALKLMRSLKQRFDPNDILNPGRFVGGI
jgi:glycolate oxidase FAD binding subunit